MFGKDPDYSGIYTRKFREYPGDAYKWGLSDMYPDYDNLLREAIDNGAPFNTRWGSCKKEPRSGKVCFDGQAFTVSAFCEIDEPLYIIIEAYWHATGKQVTDPEWAGQHAHIADEYPSEFEESRTVSILDDEGEPISTEDLNKLVRETMNEVEDVVVTAAAEAYKGIVSDLASFLLWSMRGTYRAQFFASAAATNSVGTLAMNVQSIAYVEFANDGTEDMTPNAPDNTLLTELETERGVNLLPRFFDKWIANQVARQVPDILKDEWNLRAEEIKHVHVLSCSYEIVPT